MLFGFYKGHEMQDRLCVGAAAADGVKCGGRGSFVRGKHFCISERQRQRHFGDFQKPSGFCRIFGHFLGVQKVPRRLLKQFHTG